MEAIQALHNRRAIPPQTNALQVRLAGATEDRTLTLFVGNLPEGAIASSVVRDFSNWGVVVDEAFVKVPPGKPYAFVSFASQEAAADAAHKLKTAMINDKLLRVEFASPSRAN